MKILIAYASKTGTAEKCAKMLAEKLENAEVYDLTQTTKPDPRRFDAVVVGCSVRMGQMHVDARQYLQGTADMLKAMPFGLFITCGFDEQSEAIFENNVEPDLLAASKVHMSFGGEMNPDKQRGMDRFIAKMAVKAAAKDGGKPPVLFPERMDEFIAKLTK